MVEQAVQTVPVERTTQKKSLTAVPQQGRDAGRMQRGGRGPQTLRGDVCSRELNANLFPRKKLQQED